MRSREAGFRKVMIHRQEAGQNMQVDDLVACEEPLQIRLTQVDGAETRVYDLSVTLRTPGDDEILAIGFLTCEGIIQSRADIVNIHHTGTDGAGNRNIVEVRLNERVEWNFDPLRRRGPLGSSCGACGKPDFEALRIKVPTFEKTSFQTVEFEAIMLAAEILSDRQSIFNMTGGIHASALCSANGEIVQVCEDVGRHNALDKLIGHFVMANSLPLSSHFLFLSGRVSFEMMQKARMAGIQLVCAVGAPSSLAVEFGEEHDMTLVGFVRGSRMNVYSHPWRVTSRDMKRPNHSHPSCSEGH